MTKKYLIKLLIITFAFCACTASAQKNKSKKGIEVADNTIKELAGDASYLYNQDTLVITSDDFIYAVENLGDNVNTVHAESGPRISPDGKTLYFFRIAHPDNMGGTRDIWKSKLNEKDSTWGSAVHMDPPINDYGENSVHAVFNDGNSLLLHNKYLKNGDALNGVSVSHKQKDGKWSFPEALKIKHYKNDKLCSFYMNNDGSILLLAIEFKDTYGQQDLYVSFNTGDGIHYTEPKNLGPVINSTKTEATVFLATDDSTIYYSTNGKGGFGGFDIFKSKRKDSTWTNWTKPENIGVPYNTPDDEFYFSIPSSGDYAYLAHHFRIGNKKTGSEHSDIVRIKMKGHKPALLLTGNLFDAYDSTSLAGTIKFVRLSDQEIIYEGKVDSLNKYEVTLLPGEVYEYVANSGTYTEKKGKIDLTKLDHYEERTLDVYLEKPVLALSGLIYNNRTKQPINGEIIFYELKGNDTIEVVRQNVTPEDPYNVDLVAGKVYIYKVNSPNFVEPEYFEEAQIIDLTNLTERKKQTRDIYLNKLEVGTEWEIPNIYFAFDKSDLLPSSYESLDEVVKVMKEYTKVKVEIQGHTDGKGAAAYNLRLSDARAKSVVTYLASKGIDESRLVHKGYGKDKPIADNNTEEGRAKNRRVMFKVLSIN